MKLLNIIHEDFVNYKLPSMVLEFPYCTFKCNTECGENICQNYMLKDSEIVDIEVEEIINSYINNPISKSIVMQGLEPFDSYNDLVDFIDEFRKVCKDTIVIYSGYAKYEIIHYIRSLQKYGNIIIKLGRYMPGLDPIYDDILGVELASSNQRARYIEEF